ncbi:hypothetical protein NL676_009389 [Syzygium grande]|nr:hypothetical protein NL676_009389 [Syzygium grande]
MDPRLLEAAQTGNVGLLNDLIRSNALILEEAALQGAGHTQMHVACVAGHLNFVRELLKLMPKLAENVNADGFSPLHIAAARGDVEIVREILKAGRPQHLCLVKGRERIIPLHCAATNGKHNKEQVINWQDKKGDTILHLAAAAKNFEVVDFMLSGHALKRQVVEVNALNDSGSTPLDVSSCSDREIRETLMRARAKHRPSNLPSSQIVLVDDEEDDIKGDTSYQSVMKAAVENNHPPLSTPKGSNQGQELLGDIHGDLLVVATLIASATYQAVLQPPNFPRKGQTTHAKKGSFAAFLTTNSKFAENLGLFFFLSTNTFGFLVSVLMIIRLTAKLPLKWLLQLSMLYMVWTYYFLALLMPSRSLEDEDYSPLLSVGLVVTPAILIPVALLLLIIILVQNK